MMKRQVYLLGVMIGLLFVSLPVAAENLFFETLYDVPVMQDFEELPEKALSFDKPSGRVAEAGALTMNDARSVMTFYKTSLSQMGWRIIDEKSEAISFQRENEILDIFYEKSKASEGGTALVSFKLTPSSK